MGPPLGAVSGGVVATLLIWAAILVDPGSWPSVGVGLGFGLYLGSIYGGSCGAAVGLVVAIPLVFLVGRHLPRAVARRRAYVLGAVLPPLTLLAWYVVLLDGRLSWPHGDEYLAVVPLAGAALLGSILTGWLAGKDDDSARPVS